jgi:hypothetical protein
MMDQKTQDDLLLYWSGEADAAVEALLKTDLEAREYLDELDRFHVLRDELAELPAMNPSRDFSAEAVAGILVEKKIFRCSLPRVAAAAAVIALVVTGIRSWSQEGNEVVVEKTICSGESVTEEAATRPKLSQRLFSLRRQDPAINRISLARDRARKLRAELKHLPTS